MSVYKKTIKAFMQIIETQPNLLSDEDWLDLQKLANNLPENSEEISTLIRDWLKKEGRDQIKEAFEENRKNIPSEFNFSDQHLGIGGAKSPTPVNQISPSSKELLENSIKRNSPLSDTPKTIHDTNTNQKP